MKLRKWAEIIRLGRAIFRNQEKIADLQAEISEKEALLEAMLENLAAASYKSIPKTDCDSDKVDYDDIDEDDEDDLCSLPLDYDPVNDFYASDPDYIDFSSPNDAA